MLTRTVGNGLTSVKATFGKCPHCQGDGLVESDEKTSCTKCDKKWERYTLPTSQALGDGLPVHVWMWLSQGMSAIDYPTRDHIQHERLITMILNAALLSRFGFEQNFSCEGGVQGRYRARGRKRTLWVEYRNTYDRIGLTVGESYMMDYQELEPILEWHFELMVKLVSGSYQVGRKKFEPGSLFLEALSETDMILLAYFALAHHMRSKERAREVFRKLDGVRHGLFGSNLAGLSTDDIAKIFAPPHITTA